ncbi:MAG: hypothetical protein ACFCUE_07455 [Candidatus Bathyarchaeia archaeon]
MNELQNIVPTVFSGAVMQSFGMHKLVFHIVYRKRDLALKIGKKDAIEDDHKAYKKLPHPYRHVYFARVFWHTKYCLLQEYGEEVEVSPQELSQLRSVANKFGLLDISCENIRNIDGYLKIIDAALAPDGLFGLYKAADYVMLRLPPPIRRVIKKSGVLKTVTGR